MKGLRWCIGETDRDAIVRVGDLFADADRAVEKFRDLTKIRCPEGCGECCSRSKVETTVVEMMPLALELWSSGTAESWFARIRAALEDSTCVFFQTQAEGASIQGRCMVYSLRPLICRLFGFFTVRNKHGKYVYGSCRVIKQTYPRIYENAVRVLEQTPHPSVCTDYSIRMIGIDSTLGYRMLPINRAAYLALERIGYRFDQSEDRRPALTDETQAVTG
jgi:Fe-S-cluster containining protein